MNAVTPPTPIDRSTTCSSIPPFSATIPRRSRLRTNVPAELTSRKRAAGDTTSALTRDTGIRDQSWPSSERESQDLETCDGQESSVPIRLGPRETAYSTNPHKRPNSLHFPPPPHLRFGASPAPISLSRFLLLHGNLDQHSKDLDPDLAREEKVEQVELDVRKFLDSRGGRA